MSQAQAQVGEILDYLETKTVEGTTEPLRIYLTCYRVLRTNHDPRVQAVLDQAHHLLQEWVGRIEDENLRRSFLENIPAHREISREHAQVTATRSIPLTSAPSIPETLVEPLTRRQKEMLHLIVTGLTNQEIAENSSPASVLSSATSGIFMASWARATALKPSGVHRSWIF